MIHFVVLKKPWRERQGWGSLGRNECWYGLKSSIVRYEHAIAEVSITAFAGFQRGFV